MKGALALVLVAALASCSAVRQASPKPSAQLTATLVTPTDIALSWQADDPTAAGHVIEFATEPRGPYTILGFLPPGQTTFTHPDLIPQTPFYYRLRAYYGQVTNEVAVTLPPGAYDEETQREEPSGWTTPRTLPGGPANARPGAAPTTLKAAVEHANGIAFTWTDNSTDEEAFLLEDRPSGRQTYRVVAQIDPDINYFGLIAIPDEKRATYRIRSIRFGQPSNLAHQTTKGS